MDSLFTTPSVPSDFLEALTSDELDSLSDVFPKIFLERTPFFSPLTSIQKTAISKLLSLPLDPFFLAELLRGILSADRLEILSSQPSELLSYLSQQVPDFAYLFSTSSKHTPDDTDSLLSVDGFISTLAHDILNRSLSLSEFLPKTKALPHFSTPSLLKIGTFFASSFYTKLPLLEDSESFEITLKYYHALTVFVILFPELLEKLHGPVSSLIMQFKQFPSTEWVIRVLDQLPPYLLSLLFDLLYNYETLRSFEKRHFYCKLLQDLSVYLEEHPEYSGPVLEHL